MAESPGSEDTTLIAHTAKYHILADTASSIEKYTLDRDETNLRDIMFM